MLTEIEGKSILADYGIKTTSPVFAEGPEEAVEASKKFNDLLAMKVVSPDIAHKLDAGGVRLNVHRDDVNDVFNKIVDACKSKYPQAKIHGVLIEPMVTSGIEVFIGARNDGDYGPIVLFGIGGSNIESFVPAITLGPLSKKESKNFINKFFKENIKIEINQEVKDKIIAYTDAIVGSNGLFFKENLSELDVNPIIITENDAIAVDALMVRDAGNKINSHGDFKKLIEEKKLGLSKLDALFNPESIAFIGASTSPDKVGNRNILHLLDFGFDKNKIYPIHPKADTICGIKAYKSVVDIPGNIDRAFIAISANQVPSALQDCAKKGVSVAQVLSAGFSEWTDGIERSKNTSEDQFKKVIKETGIRVVGPNCIGAYSSRGKMTMIGPRYSGVVPGDITFVSQSGTFAGDLIRRSKVQGIKLGQVLSCGNCIDLDFIDYLLFAENDPNTKIIVFYIESLEDPGTFFRLAQKAKKPIIIWKGGVTKQGQKAAVSHSAALANDLRLWQAACYKAGVSSVSDINELMDLLLIYQGHESLHGNALAIFGSGGGVFVGAADKADELGMKIPELTKQSINKLERFSSPGANITNPVDIPVWSLQEHNGYVFSEVLGVLSKDENISTIIVYLEVGYIFDYIDSNDAAIKKLTEMCEAIVDSSTDKNLSLCIRSSGDEYIESFIRTIRPKFLEKNVPVFSSVRQAVSANASLYKLTQSLNRRV